MEDTDLETIHGDTWKSPVWAILDGEGLSFDLSGWHVRSQLRRHVSSSTVVYEWDLEHGIEVVTAVVEKLGGTNVTTSGIVLKLSPADYDGLPSSFTGVLDVEISSDNSPNPDQRFTVVPPRSFHIRPDVSRG